MSRPYIQPLNESEKDEIVRAYYGILSELRQRAVPAPDIGDGTVSAMPKRLGAAIDALMARIAELEQVRPFDLVAHLVRQREFSSRTFGPLSRRHGCVEHIRKELTEIEADPQDLSEWIDVIILGFDGAWRTGAEPAEIVTALVAKQAKNESRKWPDWRSCAEGTAIEHDRSGDPAANRSAKHQPMQVIDVIKGYLKSVKADGLCNEDGCGCPLSELAPCGGIAPHCVPASEHVAKEAGDGYDAGDIVYRPITIADDRLVVVA